MGYSGNPVYATKFRQHFDMMGLMVSHRLSQECLNDFPNDQWLCFFGQYASWYTRTPFFLVNSFYDSWQMTNILHVSHRCSVGLRHGQQSSCIERELNALHGFHHAMLRATASLSHHGNAHFLYSCVTPSAQFNVDSQWVHLAIDNVTLRRAFGDWYLRNVSVKLEESLLSTPAANPACAHNDLESVSAEMLLV